MLIKMNIKREREIASLHFVTTSSSFVISAH